MVNILQINSTLRPSRIFFPQIATNPKCEFVKEFNLINNILRNAKCLIYAFVHYGILCKIFSCHEFHILLILYRKFALTLNACNTSECTLQAREKNNQIGFKRKEWLNIGQSWIYLSATGLLHPPYSIQNSISTNSPINLACPRPAHAATPHSHNILQFAGK